MLAPGDVVELAVGAPTGSEAGRRRPAVVVTAERALRGGPSVIQVVPLTRALRDRGSEIPVGPEDRNGLDAAHSAQCQHIRSVATTRVVARLGGVGPVVLRRIRDALAVLLDA